MNTSGEITVAPAATLPVPMGPGITIIPLIQFQDDLAAFDDPVEDINGQVTRAVIKDEATYQAGSDLLSAITAQLKLLEEKRVATKKPADDYGAMVQKLVKPIKEALDASKLALSNKMVSWRNEEEARQRKAQEEVRRQQEAEAARLAEAARSQGNEATAERIEEMVAAAPAPAAIKVGHANFTGKTHAKRVYWNGEVVEPMVVLKAIMDGKIPISAIDWNKSSLNKVADEVAKKWPEGEQRDVVHNTIYLGIKITKDEKLV